jgi:hypothetical protein
MANQDTQILDDIIVASRRKMMTFGVASLAGLVLGTSTPKASAQAGYTDNDILNFALNLEYLESNYYYLSAFGCTIDKPNAAAIAAGAPAGGIPITIAGGVGTAGTVTGGSKVPFATTTVGSYAVETAIEEGKHVLTLQGALGSLAVNQPAINLDVAPGQNAAWPTLASAAGVAGGAAFSPYTTDANFLAGAYVFEDVGVTAYHGAASLIVSAGILSVAAGILAVEGYHAGLVRTTINYLDPDDAAGYITITNQVSTLRAALSKAALLGVTPAPAYDTQPDDYGLANTTVALPGGSAPSTRLVDVTLNTTTDPYSTVAFARSTTQVLNIVTGGGAVNKAGTAVVSPATGVFFPNGLNGLFA